MLTDWLHGAVLLQKLTVAQLEIFRLLYFFHYCVQKSPPPDTILSHMNPIHTPKPYFSAIHFNIILPSTPRFSKWFSALQVSRLHSIGLCISHLSNACYLSRPPHTPRCYHHNNIWWRVQIMKLLTVKFSLASCYFCSWIHHVCTCTAFA
jgi:hypothetical protein